jgi:hypothetical protein
VIALSLTLIGLRAEEKEKIDIPIEPPSEWKTLTNEQAWDYYYKLYKEYLLIFEAYDKLSGIDKDKNVLITEYEKQLDRKVKKHLLSFQLTGGINKNNTVDLLSGWGYTVQVGINYNRIFFNTALIGIGVYFQPYMAIGGGINLQAGFLF